MNHLFSWIRKRLTGKQQDNLEYLCHSAQHLKDLFDYASSAPVPLMKGSAGSTYSPARDEPSENIPDRIHPLDFNTLLLAELILGKNLGSVLIHTGPEADRKTRSAGAEALASDRDIYIREGLYRTDSSEGRARLIHELAHTAQTGGGRKAEFREDREELEREAESKEEMLNPAGWHDMERGCLEGDGIVQEEKLIRIIGRAGEEYLMTEEELEEVKEEAREKLADWLSSEWDYFDEEKKVRLMENLFGGHRI